MTDSPIGKIPDTLRSLEVDVGSLVPYGANPRRGDVEVIAQSLRVNGQYRPIVVRAGTNEVLAGNHTLAAARALGWSRVAATFVDVDDEGAKRIVLVDNRANDLATYDDRVLADMLGSLPDLDGTGFDDSDLDRLLAGLDSGRVRHTEPDDAPPLPTADPITHTGDVWLLGPHRVACGDSTSPTVLERLCDGRVADLLWTDPPYGVAYVGKTADALTIQNDQLDPAALRSFLGAALGNAVRFTRPGAVWFVASPAGPLFGVFGQVLADLEVWRHTITWVKDQFVMGRADYHYRHEPIFYGWTPGAAHRPPPDRRQDTVWEIDRPKRSAVHPTMKPVALIARAVENHTDVADLVLDPFGGSGSTLIAADGLGRTAYLAELDPRYVDVICRRYEEHTGVVPVLSATGEQCSFRAER